MKCYIEFSNYSFRNGLDGESNSVPFDLNPFNLFDATGFNHLAVYIKCTFCRTKGNFK